MLENANKKELPKRKPTRLNNFDYSTNGAYFITICTQDRKNILSTISANSGYSVGEVEVATSVTTAMEWFKYQATKEINILRNTAGEKVFQRSFYDHIVCNRDDYNKIYQYICDNPIRWQYDKLYSEE